MIQSWTEFSYFQISILKWVLMIRIFQQYVKMRLKFYILDFKLVALPEIILSGHALQ